ncbi:hypothetical protein [uncultured Enterovirga sp.]|uniref:hypothetical protein n=1 Tax=uncultured Enterovirga sp. TaxID=2026352 RepID=UPI0035CBFB06
MPGRDKSSALPFSYAQRSSAFETNSGPLSTLIVRANAKRMGVEPQDLIAELTAATSHQI